ncbi:unnamed protein product, partial [Sphacelaria rigidula]
KGDQEEEVGVGGAALMIDLTASPTPAKGGREQSEMNWARESVTAVTGEKGKHEEASGEGARKKKRTRTTYSEGGGQGAGAAAFEPALWPPRHSDGIKTPAVNTDVRKMPTAINTDARKIESEETLGLVPLNKTHSMRSQKVMTVDSDTDMAAMATAGDRGTSRGSGRARGIRRAATDGSGLDPTPVKSNPKRASEAIVIDSPVMPADRNGDGRDDDVTMQSTEIGIRDRGGKSAVDRKSGGATVSEVGVGFSIDTRPDTNRRELAALRTARPAAAAAPKAKECSWDKAMVECTRVVPGGDDGALPGGVGFFLDTTPDPELQKVVAIEQAAAADATTSGEGSNECFGRGGREGRDLAVSMKRSKKKARWSYESGMEIRSGGATDIEGRRVGDNGSG